jgi:hypothetical protein
VLDARRFSVRFFRPPGQLLRLTGLAFSTLQAEAGVETLSLEVSQTPLPTWQDG